MGTKRVGLARVEALIEALDRDINLADSTLTNCTITTDQYATFTGGVQVTHAALTPAASVTLTKADHAGRLLTIASTATGNDEYIIPVAASAGESYRFVWSGVAIDTDDILFVAPSADALSFEGGILDFKTDEAGAAMQIMVYPGADDDKVQITNVQGFDLTFTALSTTNYVVSGWVMSTDTQTAFGDL